MEHQDGSPAGASTPAPSRFRRALTAGIIITMLAICGLAAGVFAASLLGSPASEPDPAATAGVSDTTDGTPAPAPSTTVSVTATRAIPAPDRDRFPPGVPSASLAKGGSTGVTGQVAQLATSTVTVNDTRCDITKVVEWSRPGGGIYCVISVTFAAKGTTPVTVTAVNQLIYGVPARVGAPNGYQGTFFLNQDKTPTPDLTVAPGQPVNALIVFDVRTGFTGTQLVPQER